MDAFHESYCLVTIFAKRFVGNTIFTIHTTQSLFHEPFVGNTIFTIHTTQSLFHDTFGRKYYFHDSCFIVTISRYLWSEILFSRLMLYSHYLTLWSEILFSRFMLYSRYNFDFPSLFICVSFSHLSLLLEEGV